MHCGKRFVTDITLHVDNILVYDLVVTDLMSTADGSNLDMECTQLYSLQLEDKITDLTTELVAELEQGMCDEGDAVMAGSSKVFSAIANQVGQ